MAKAGWERGQSNREPIVYKQTKQMNNENKNMNWLELGSGKSDF